MIFFRQFEVVNSQIGKRKTVAILRTFITEEFSNFFSSNWSYQQSKTAKVLHFDDFFSWLDKAIPVPP